jgi:ADP-ribose pyrophosphatase YjhB (NUDIX family)
MYNSKDIHHIQKDIISKLAYNSPLRFSELQPPRVPNNTFSYHLKKLLETGYIESTNSGYIATRKALKTLHYSPDKERRITYPLLLSVVYVTDNTGRVLLLKRRNKPFANWFGVPSGLIHGGETLESAAKRELFEKTGISTLKPLEYVGVLDFRYLEKESDDLFVHAVAFVYKYKCENPNDVTLSEETKYGDLDWSGLTRDKILPEVHAIAELVNGKKPKISSVDFEEPVD